VVTAGAVSAFQVSGFPSSTTAGVAGTVTVVAVDAYGNVVTGYTGTVTFSSSDAQAGLPANYTFTASDAGAHTFSVTLKTAGTQSLTVRDTVSATITGTQGGISVNAAAATHFKVTAPSRVIIGTPFSVTVVALDDYGNVATGYRGKVHFTSSDHKATLPADYTFTAADNGQHVFRVTLIGGGTQTVTVTDIAHSSITGKVAVSSGH
jgi:hypothetical protein